MALRDDLHEWLAAQSPWQQDLAKRLASRTHLDGDEYDDALAMVKGAFDALPDGTAVAEPETIALDDLPAGSTAGPSPRLAGFGRLQGVGIVADDQELTFAADGLTIIYGANATGKTTYVRGLKRVCRAVDCDTQVRGNIFLSPTGPPATAKVEFLVSGERRAQQLNLTSPPNLDLDAISVFDARCAELYVDEMNAVAYVPSAVLVLTRLAVTQDRMRRDITSEISELTAKHPRFPELGVPTAAKARVDGLGATTHIEELRGFATLDEEEQARGAELRAVIAAATSKGARTDAQAARQDAAQATALAQQLRDLEVRIDGAAIETLRTRATEAAQANAALELAAKEFSDLPVPGVGEEPWERLWRAARDFSEATGGAFPPAAGDRCPLCLQEVEPDAAARMGHFEAHVKSSIHEQASAAAESLKQVAATVDEQHVIACRTRFVAGLEEREPALHKALEQYLSAVSARMTLLRDDPGGPHSLPALDNPAGSVETWGRARDGHAETLLATDDPEQERKLRAELAELDARATVLARFGELESWVAVLAHIASLQSVHTALATNRITSLQRRLSDEVVTETLASKLREELKRLDCEHLPVDLEPHTAVGTTEVALRLLGAHDAPPVSEILSEGEHRALALAFFFAEVATSEGDGGIIVDDPVSSLDDQRREYIAKRLVAESERRQVIVFTHDLPFMLDLTDQVEAAGSQPFVQALWRIESTVGRVDDHPPFATLKLRDRLSVLTTTVEVWDKQPPSKDADEAWARVCEFYRRMRMAWERAVEERLFRGVVQRFQRAVMTQKLKTVTITPELVAAVDDGMTRCSAFVHDAPQGTRTTLPGRRDLAEDLAKLHAFEVETRPTS